MEEGGAAPQISDDEERFFDGLSFVRGEEDIVEPETEPMEQRTEGPDRVEKRKENDSSSVEGGGCVFGVEK